MQEIEQLKKQGLNAVIVPKDRYFQIAIGAYADVTGAQKDLKRVRRLYKDAYLKVR